MTKKEFKIIKKQRLRIVRTSMAFATYIVVIFAALLVTKLGYGQMSSMAWSVFISLALIGNGVFYMLIITNVNLKFNDPSLTREQIIFSTLWGLIPLYYLQDARPIVLMFYIPAFSFGMLRLNRKQYYNLVVLVMVFYASILTFEFVEDRQGFMIQHELFIYILFGILLSWFAFFGGFISNLRERLNEQNKDIQETHKELKRENNERKKTQKEKDKLIVALQKALSEVKTLSGFLPICSSCKKIRDDKGYWNQIESYIRDHSEAQFSHSICPECAKKHYPELYEDVENSPDQE